jgi:DNA-binding NtrC family response regulator
MSSPINPILLIDDEQQFLQSASFSLRSCGLVNVECCSDSTKVMGLLSGKPYSAILMDIMMPILSGKDLLPQISQTFPEIPVIMLTALCEIDTAVECIKLGAFDYQVKPIDKARLVTTITRAIEFGELKKENARLKTSLLNGSLENPGTFENIITCSPSMKSLFQYIEAIAPTTLPALVIGETGSGKELIAKAIHKASDRKGAFVAVNVAGLDDTLFSDTLFGHERGAFTGADNKRQGLVAKASGGTLFLDEIGDLKIESQVKLLRLLEDKSYYPIGSDALLTTDTRIVLATNCDLHQKQLSGAFRSDLYFRLASHIVRIPPLRKRKDDIELLLAYFLEKAAAEMSKKVPRMPPELVILLNTHYFPGNIRELKGMVYDAMSRYKSGILSLDSFKEQITVFSSVSESLTIDTPAEPQNGLKMLFTEQLPTLKEAENTLVAEALQRSKGNQAIAASLLGITRSALNKRINHT